MVTGASGGDQIADDLFALLEELDRLEELIEDMDSLGVHSREEAERRLAEVDARVEKIAPGERDSS
ncbi:MAG: hypothetical protein ACRDJH_07040 [Thermomicrobiales bacterium]